MRWKQKDFKNGLKFCFLLRFANVVPILSFSLQQNNQPKIKTEKTFFFTVFFYSMSDVLFCCRSRLTVYVVQNDYAVCIHLYSRPTISIQYIWNPFRSNPFTKMWRCLFHYLKPLQSLAGRDKLDEILMELITGSLNFFRDISRTSWVSISSFIYVGSPTCIFRFTIIDSL